MLLTISKHDNHNLVGSFPDLKAIQEYVENEWDWKDKLEFHQIQTKLRHYEIPGLKATHESNQLVPHNGWAFYVVWSE